MQGPTTGCYWPLDLSGICGIYYSTASFIDDEDGDSTWYVSFDTGEVMAAPKGGDYGEVRCVRNQ